MIKGKIVHRILLAGLLLAPLERATIERWGLVVST